MEIILENFGKIKYADVKLNGLTLIAGQNDTGKSTVGKCLFALIKSIYNYDELFSDLTERNIMFNFRELITPFLREYEIEENLKKTLTEIKFGRFSKLDRKVLLEYVFKIKNIVERQENKENKDKDKDNIILPTINKIIILDDNQKNFLPSKKLEIILDVNVFSGTFFGNINNSVHSKDISRIIYRQSEKNVIADLSIDDNKFKINNFNISNLGMASSDVIFIESPLYLEEGRDSNSSYTQDLLDKKNIIKKCFNDVSTHDNDDILKDFETIFGNSKFIYNTENRIIKYKVNEQSNELMIHNIASGSKSFGLIYLLLKTAVIKKMGC